jgi:hypothetical protein
VEEEEGHHAKRQHSHEIIVAQPIYKKITGFLSLLLTTNYPFGHHKISYFLCEYKFIYVNVYL